MQDSIKLVVNMLYPDYNSFLYELGGLTLDNHNKEVIMKEKEY